LVEANLVHIGHEPLGAVAQQMLLKLDCNKGEQNDGKRSQTSDAQNAKDPSLAGHHISVDTGCG
jgi:hypothetical protein